MMWNEMNFSCFEKKKVKYIEATTLEEKNKK